MSENNQSAIITSEECNKDELASSEKITEDVPAKLEYEKQQLFVVKANTTFRELCKTLENEQNKLSELETRRKQLQEEMLLLKAEIEEEMKCLNVNMEQSVAEKLNALNNFSSSNVKLPDENQTVSESIKQSALCTCYEEEEHQPATIRSSHVETSIE